MDFDVTRRRIVVAGTAVSVSGLAFGGLAASRVQDEGSEERTTDTFSEIYDIAELSVTTEVGSVSVTGADRETVELEVERRGTEGSLDRTALAVDVSANSLDVTLDYDQTLLERIGLTADSRPETEIVLTVPYELERAALETRNGSIDASSVESSLAASTTNGDISLEDVSAIGSLSSTNGEIEANVERLADGAVIETTSGDIDVTADAVGVDVTVESTNGAIEYALGDATDATVLVTTSTGDISLAADSADSITQTDTELEATVGDGTNRLQFETTNGDVTITD